MLKNKEIRILIYIELIVLITGVISVVSINNHMFESYREEIINNNAYIINKLIEKYPELESEIVNSFINHDITITESREILAKYGLDDTKNIDYLGHNMDIKKSYLI